MSGVVEKNVTSLSSSKKKDAKQTKRKESTSSSSKKKRKATSQQVNKEDTSGRVMTGRWHKDEHQTFLEGIRIHGKEWKKIASMIPTRTVVQIRTHAQKYFQKLAKKNNQNLQEINGRFKKKSKVQKASPKKGQTAKRKKIATPAKLKTAASVRVPADEKVAEKKRKSSSFKTSMNLSLQLPNFDGSKETGRENSPTSIADLESIELNDSFNGSFISSSFLHGVDSAPEEPALSNWLNDVDEDSEGTSDSCSSSLGDGSPLDTSSTIYVDTRTCEMETIGNLESYDFESCGFIVPSRIAGVW